MERAEIDIDELQQQLSMAEDVTLIDIRGAEAWSDGVIAGAKLLLADQVLEQWSEIYQSSPVYLICNRGNQSLQLQQTILQHHPKVQHVCSVRGGYQAWNQRQWPLQPVDIANEALRYSRQLALPDFTQAEQDKLKQARVFDW